MNVRRGRVFLCLCALTIALVALKPSATSLHTPMDYTGDGRADFAVTRIVNGAIQWWIADAASSGYMVANWGDQQTHGDTALSGDFDGDGKADLVLWRITGPGIGFWIVSSATGQGQYVDFGGSGDDITVSGDYDGDGTMDLATYRQATTPGGISYWWYRAA